MMKVDKFNTEVSGKSLMYVIENDTFTRRCNRCGSVVLRQPDEIVMTDCLNPTEGDPMELFVEDGAVCFKKYDVAKNIMEDFTQFKNNVEEDIYDMSIPAEKRSEIFRTLKVLSELLKEEY